MIKYTASNIHKTAQGLISSEDVDLLKRQPNLDSCGYARIGRKRLHRLVMERIIGGEIPKGLVVDHKDRNPLNNTRENLRLGSYSDNSVNKVKHRGTSKFLGVSWYTKKNRWRAQVKRGGKVLYTGLFKSEVAAALFYNEKSIEIHGEYANINVI